MSYTSNDAIAKVSYWLFFIIKAIPTSSANTITFDSVEYFSSKPGNSGVYSQLVFDGAKLKAGLTSITYTAKYGDILTIQFGTNSFFTSVTYCSIRSGLKNIGTTYIGSIKCTASAKTLTITNFDTIDITFKLKIFIKGDHQATTPSSSDTVSIKYFVNSENNPDYPLYVLFLIIKMI